MMRHQLLVRSHHRLASHQSAADPVVRGPKAADDLDHDVGVRLEDLVGRLRPAHRGRHPVDPFSCDVAVEDVREADVRHFTAAKDAGNRLADGTESKQGHTRDVGRSIPWQCHSSAPV
jgi:hypothetical protein